MIEWNQDRIEELAEQVVTSMDSADLIDCARENLIATYSNHPDVFRDDWAEEFGEEEE